MDVLKVSDRCDYCGARAKVEAVFRSGSPLLFCGHCYRERKVEIDRQAVTVLDETGWTTADKGSLRPAVSP